MTSARTKTIGEDKCQDHQFQMLRVMQVLLTNTSQILKIAFSQWRSTTHLPHDPADPNLDISGHLPNHTNDRQSALPVTCIETHGAGVLGHSLRVSGLDLPDEDDGSRVDDFNCDDKVVHHNNKMDEPKHENSTEHSDGQNPTAELCLPTMTHPTKPTSYQHGHFLNGQQDKRCHTDLLSWRRIHSLSYITPEYGALNYLTTRKTTPLLPPWTANGTDIPCTLESSPRSVMFIEKMDRDRTGLVPSSNWPIGLNSMDVCKDEKRVNVRVVEDLPTNIPHDPPDPNPDISDRQSALPVTCTETGMLNTVSRSPPSSMMFAVNHSFLDTTDLIPYRNWLTEVDSLELCKDQHNEHKDNNMNDPWWPHPTHHHSYPSCHGLHPTTVYKIPRG